MPYVGVKYREIKHKVRASALYLARSNSDARDKETHLKSTVPTEHSAEPTERARSIKDDAMNERAVKF